MNQGTIGTLLDKKLSMENINLLGNILNDIKTIDNIQAIVLGGSYSIGSARKDSDMDIGIYYFADKSFSINAIKEVAKKYDKDNNPTVTEFYEWGPWVNGGAWIKNIASKIDFLYRNIEQIEQTIENAKNGRYENNYEQQPPYGFSSIIYLAETKCCIPLYDPNGIVTKIKNEVEHYPKELKYSVIKNSLWAAEFTLLHLDSFYAKKDIFNIYGCLTRALKNIFDTLYAVNEEYIIGYKRAIDELENMEKVPINLRLKIENILNAGSVDNKIKMIKEFFEETRFLTDGIYESKYKL
jgi:predicted nucleotidyltransferase